MEKYKKISILGTEYTILKVSIEEDNRMVGNGGYVNLEGKKILVNEKLYGNEPLEEIFDKVVYRNEVLRHEIIHAFFNECGLSEYCDDERLIKYLGYQFPKLTKIFKELGVE